MNKKIPFVAFLLAITSTIVVGQNFIKEFGKIAKEEIEMTAYALDKDAEAVVLFDMGKSYFLDKNNTFEVVFERTTRIKVLSEAGISWGEVGIPFYQEGNIYEKIYDLEAFSYNFEDGKLVKNQLDVSNTYDEKINGFWNLRKFAVPNVKKGSVIEYRYKIESQYKFNFRDWEFQWKIPVIYSEYEVKMIPFYEYTFILQGASKFDIYETYEDKGMPRQFGVPQPYGDNSFHDLVYKYGMREVPAFKDEEYISSINDYIMKIDFQLSKIHTIEDFKIEVMTTWEDMIKKLLDHQDFGKYIEKSEKLAQKLPVIESLAQKTEMEKFNGVLDYIKSNYNWNNHSDKYATKAPNKLTEDKYGNCADLNLFAVGLLKSLGIEAYPLILSTREHGKIMLDYPFSHFFNYVVVLVKIGGKTILTDATEILALNDRIPPRCINDKGLIISKDNVEWIGLECMFASTVNTFLQMDIKENELKVDLVKSGTEYDALYFRNNYTDKIDVVKQKITSIHYSLIDSTVSVQNQFDRSKPYKLRYSFTAKPESVNNKMYISPFLEESIDDNPLKQNERKYPVDMVYPTKRIFNSTISIPEGYQVDFLPENATLNNELFDLNYSTKTLSDKIQISLTYSFKKAIYQPTDYLKIKDFFNEIIRKGNEKVVLTKI